jgi:putative glutamine amidotransferase
MARINKERGTAGGRSPLVGITTDVSVVGERERLECGAAYAERVAAAGGTPVLLPPIPELAEAHARLCDAFVFTGGNDPRMEPFGEPTHPQARAVSPRRQEYETALLRYLLAEAPATPTLGVCLGMQMMALVAGGRLDQHLPEVTPSATEHRGVHEVVPVAGQCGPVPIRKGRVLSNHHQAVADPGTLVVLARGPGGVIEAIADPGRPFYLGVQWHPERTEEIGLGADLFASLVAAARGI